MHPINITASVTMTILVGGLSPHLVSGQICGQYQTAPGAQVQYSYHDGSLQMISLPVAAEFDISCDDLRLVAVILTPIIGVDEQGNELFPTGLTYPLTVNSEYDSQQGYLSTLLDTQYNFQWTFAASTNATLWNGNVFWAGGRFEQTEIDNVELLRVPESNGTLLGLLVVATSLTRRLFWLGGF